jgi:L-fuconolactonase
MIDRIDAHVHFWRIEQYASHWMQGPLAPLKRDFLPDDLAPLLAANGVDGAIFVQAQPVESDNDWVLGLAERHPWIVGVVGWVDLTADDVEERIERLRANPRFCGIRHITHDEPDDDWILRDDVGRGLAALERLGVPFDLLFFVKHLPHAATLARRHPRLRFVIDHLAKPRIAAGSIDDWLPAFRAAAAEPNVFCKLSGMVTEADWLRWSPADLRPYVDHALASFGPERLMRGSDWPVCTLAGSYARVTAALDEAIVALSGAERAAILGGTARRFYGLGTS